MNILKKFFLVSLFCSFFVVSASADTFDFQYSNKVKSSVNEHSILLDNASNYIKEHATQIESIFNDSRLDILNDKNVLFYPNINFNDESFSVMILANCNDSSCFHRVKGTSLGLYYFWIKLYFDSSSNEILSFTPVESTMGSSSFNIRYDGIGDRFFDFRLGKNTISVFSNQSSYDLTLNSNNDILPANSTFPGTLYDFALTMDYGLVNQTPVEPTYSYNVEPSKNGNYKVNFKFENYTDENTNYRFSLLNKFSQESFGEENSYKNYCFYDIEDLYNTIPFGTEYSIEVDNSTFLELKLYRYDKIDECYEEIEVKNEFIDVNMINNSYFETEPNFVVDRIEHNVLSGHFENLPQGPNFSSLNTCSYSFSNNPDNKIEFNCQEKVDIEFEHNGYISVSLSRNNMTLYNRKINVSGGSIDKPKILYDIENNVGYSNIKWSINNQNYSSNISYRYSLNNGLFYHKWTLITSDNFENIIKVTETNKVILEIKDNETNEIFDSVVIPINIGYSSTIVDNVDLDNYQNLIGYLPPGPVDSILNLPLSFLKSVSKSLLGVCNPVKITLPFVETKIELPCQNEFYKKIGATNFLNYVGIIASTIMLYSYLVYLYKWVDKIMHLENIEVNSWGSKL